ncbi:MAG: hypothetical protein HN597_03620 [Desulfobacula sp.]|jgi:hypothetical protein|uniref:phage adaptor protein n=1 Tax=Desulfobacula sp. TaxID=2593537 RepID=UPI0039B945C1|nr:hypothetical protein [Desulfobacula sp.]
MNTIETHTLELIGEDPNSPDVFTEGDGMKPIRDSINDAIEEISMLTGCYSEKYYLALRQNRNFYRFDFSYGSFAWITDVWLVTQKYRLEQTDLIRLNNYNMRWLYETGPCQAYFQIGLNHIGVWPAPALDTDMLEISIITIPDRYEGSTDRIKLRRNWERAAAHYATGEYFASRGDAKTAIYHHNTYLKKMGVKVQYPIAAETINQFQSTKEPWPKNTG